MTELRTPFSPDWILLPGASILDAAEERGWTQLELAQRLGYSEKHMSQLINGKVSLSVDAAQRLERVFGNHLDFWLSLEANYQKHKARLEANALHTSWVPWLDELPLKALIDCGAIPKLRLVSKNKPRLVDECLRFFGVASPADWRLYYASMQVSFRRSRAEQGDVAAITAWLRRGEQQAEKLRGTKYDKIRFEKKLLLARNLTREKPEVFEPQLRRLLQDAGVLLAIVPAMPRTHVSGVARWLGPTRPLIQLSLYGKTNDKFWFSFFHEAGHILLHSENKKDKKTIFLDDPQPTHAEELQEHEANEWARNCLIPTTEAPRLPTLKTKKAVIGFAREIGVHPGIVVGRLQHDKLIAASCMNDLRETLRR
jgi:HTH-type transcriptional regulator/antitoxin HigA